MDGADAVAILRRDLDPLVASADRLGFEVLRGTMVIAPGAPAITADQIIRVVGWTGMRAEPWAGVRPGAAEAGVWRRRGRTVMAALSGTFLVAGFLADVAAAGLAAAGWASRPSGTHSCMPMTSIRWTSTRPTGPGWGRTPSYSARSTRTACRRCCPAGSSSTHIPYPMGFFTRNVQGRIDAARAGWKGRAAWTAGMSETV